MKYWEDETMEEMDPLNPFGLLAQQVSDAMSAIGLHADNIYTQQLGEIPEDVIGPLMEQSPDDQMESMVDLVKDGTVEYAVIGQFRVGRLAWTDRILYPEKFSDDALFREMIPTEAEVLRSLIQEQLDAGVEAADVVIPDEFKDLG